MREYPSPADGVAGGRSTLVKWALRQVREFTASRPELRANLLRIVSTDPVTKLRDVATTAPSLAAETPRQSDRQARLAMVDQKQELLLPSARAT